MVVRCELRAMLSRLADLAVDTESEDAWSLRWNQYSVNVGTFCGYYPHGHGNPQLFHDSMIPK